MCTLTLAARDNGYLLAMNRDERVTRGTGTIAEIHQCQGAHAVYPTDGTAGTWIAVNECGIALALLNWNVPAAAEIQSRGQLIPALAGSRSFADSLAVLRVLALDRTMPFRMVGVFPAERAVQEWRWNSRELDVVAHPWESKHWFSSSLSDDEAQTRRETVCREAAKDRDAGSAAWLRRLHATHSDDSAAFSLCVHREGVVTLSYTEINYSPPNVALQHFVGSPCRMNAADLQQITISNAGPVPPSALLRS